MADKINIITVINLIVMALFLYFHVYSWVIMLAIMNLLLFAGCILMNVFTGQDQEGE